MLRSRVPAPAAFVAISLEVLAAWPVIVVASGWLAWQYAPEWWQEAGPRLSAAAATAWPWVAAVVVVSVLAWRWARRRVGSPAARQLRRPVRRAMVYWRRMPTWPLVASVPLSLINLATRVAILPVLALTLAQPPAAWGRSRWARSRCSTASSSCRRRPAPGRSSSGFSAAPPAIWCRSEGWLLLAWRFYTNGIGVLLGVALAARIYGWPALRQLAGRWSDPH